MDQPDDAVRTIEAQVAMLLRLAERSRRSAARRRGEIDRSAYLVLGVLGTLGPANVNAIADALRLDPSTVTRQVLAMEDAGQVTRRADPTDGRATGPDVPPEHRPGPLGTRALRPLSGRARTVVPPRGPHRARRIRITAPGPAAAGSPHERAGRRRVLAGPGRASRSTGSAAPRDGHRSARLGSPATRSPDVTAPTRSAPPPAHRAAPSRRKVTA
jgi:DNA-binding transcriptional ArsR family regulator